MDTELALKPLVPGECRGRVLILDQYLSFFGEVDPETGCIRGSNICFPGRVLVFRGSRGSTVGPYIIYALKKNDKAPVCMIVEEAEPLLVAGCVLAGIPLYISTTRIIDKLENDTYIVVNCNGGLCRVEAK